MQSSELVITVASLTYGGDALGRLPDGRAVFVPFALPGEKVRLRLVEEKRGHARAELLEVIEASPQRIVPPCAHFGLCGGCHYQQLPYPAQLSAKREILREQLQRIGGLAHPPLQEPVGCAQAFHYRNHIQFHLTPEGKLGYHKSRSNEVLAIQECHLPEPPLDELWRQLDFEALLELERIGLRQGEPGDIQLILESRDPQPPEFSVEELAISAVHLSQAGALVLAGSEAVVFEVLGRAFRVSAGSFFQVNTAMAAAMVEHVLDYLDTKFSLPPEAAILDAYCGVGLFSAFLAERAGRLIGIEASPSATEDFVANLDEFDHVELYESTVEMALAHLRVKPDVIVVDPPRTGIEKGALDHLLTLAAPLLVYVSCDPATLARDARRLAEGGYSLEQITPFDLFPQTYHIESIGFWVHE